MIPTSAFTFAPLAARNGGTPCSQYYYGCSAVPSFPARAEIALLPHHPPASLGIIIFIANVRGQGTRHLVEGTLDPLVGILLFDKGTLGHLPFRAIAQLGG